MNERDVRSGYCHCERSEGEIIETEETERDTVTMPAPPPHSTRSSVTRITREERERNRTAGEGEVNRTEPSEERHGEPGVSPHRTALSSLHSSLRSLRSVRTRAVR